MSLNLKTPLGHFTIGADLNCSAGPDKMVAQLRRLKEYAAIPLIAKPNAGIPKVVDGKVVIDPNACNHCGRCRGKCLFDAISYTDGYKVSIGGRWGKKTATAQPLNRVFTTEEEVLDMVEKAICFFRDEGISGERFAEKLKNYL